MCVLDYSIFSTKLSRQEPTSKSPFDAWGIIFSKLHSFFLFIYRRYHINQSNRSNMLSTMMRKSTLVTSFVARGIARRGYADLRGSGEKVRYLRFLESCSHARCSRFAIQVWISESNPRINTQSQFILAETLLAQGAFRVWMEENPYMNMGLGIFVGYFSAVYIDRNIVRPKLEDKPKH